MRMNEPSQAELDDLIAAPGSFRPNGAMVPTSLLRVSKAHGGRGCITALGPERDVSSNSW
jgi:hypothetical protein